MIDALDKTSDNMKKTLEDSASSLQQTMENSRTYLVAFHQTVDKFNSGVRDFSEVDYNLRGTVERMDVAIRDLSSALRQITRSSEKGDRQ